MAAPAVTYTFSNSTTADASQVNQNFADVINGMSDGTKDFSISALTVAGTATLNGNVALGNAAGDDISMTGSLASSIPIKTTNAFNIGSSTLGLASIYFGANSQTVRLLPSGSMSATWSMTLPTTAGTNNFVLQTNGSGVTSWAAIVDANISAGAAIDGTKLVAASASVAGAVTTGTQTFAGVKTFQDGVIGKTGSHATTFTFNGTGGTSASVTIFYEIIGDFVLLFLPQVTATSGTSSTTFTNNTALPVAIRPTTTATLLIPAIRNNGNQISNPGFASITSGGTLTIFRDGTGTAFTNATVCGVDARTAIEYYIGSGS